MTPLAHHQLSAGATIGRRLAAGAVVAGLGLAIGLPSAVAQDRPADPGVLTERFPLDAVETAPRPPAAPEPREPAAPPSEEATPPAPVPAEPAPAGGSAGDSSGDSAMLIVIAAAVALLAVGLVGGLGLRRRFRTPDPPIPPRRRARAPDGRAGAAAIEARFRPPRDDPAIDTPNARIRRSEVPPVSQPDPHPAPPPASPPPVVAARPGRDAGSEAPPTRARRRRDPVAQAPPARAEPPREGPPRPEPPAPDITLVEAAPGGPGPRPRVRDDSGPPLPDITLIGGDNGAAGRRDALPGVGEDLEPPARPSLDELPDITLVEAPPPPSPPQPAPARRAVDPGSAALAARIRPGEAQLDAAAQALRSRTPRREEGERPEVFWSARERARTELEAAAAAAGPAPPAAPPPPDSPDPEDEAGVSAGPPPSLPSAVLEIATPRHPPAAAAVPVAVIHGLRSALRAFRTAPREEEPDPDEERGSP